MNVMITGNNGYVGTVLAEVLLEKSFEVTGYDTDYYRGCLLYECDQPIRQITKDIRDVCPEDLAGIDAVIHLAALSNDPLGELSPDLTEKINLDATVNIAKMARKAGVSRFVYASSQSMYGISDTDDELDEDNSKKHPLTAYAATKWEAECQLKKLNCDNFTVVCFRPSTVFGASPKLRCDIVFNNLMSSAYTTGKIEIKSDGTPWRPVIHVRDLAQAFTAGLTAPGDLVSGQSFNVGIENGNFTVRDLAEAIGEVMPSSEIIFTGEHGNDARTYRVCFKKILTVLSDYYKPEWNLKRGAKELLDVFSNNDFSEADFRSHKFTRLLNLERLLNERKLDENLRWID